MGAKECVNSFVSTLMMCFVQVFVVVAGQGTTGEKVPGGSERV